jgi:hypothetical protein
MSKVVAAVVLGLVYVAAVAIDPLASPSLPYAAVVGLCLLLGIVATSD